MDKKIIEGNFGSVIYYDKLAINEKEDVIITLNEFDSDIFEIYISEKPKYTYAYIGTNLYTNVSDIEFCIRQKSSKEELKMFVSRKTIWGSLIFHSLSDFITFFESLDNKLLLLKKCRSLNEYCYSLIDIDYKYITYIRDPSLELCLYAIEKVNCHFECGQLIEHTDAPILKKYKDKLMYAIYGKIPKKYHADEWRKKKLKENGMLLEFIEEQNNEICEIAINQNPRAIKYVQHKTPELIDFAKRHYIKELKALTEDLELLMKE